MSSAKKKSKHPASLTSATSAAASSTSSSESPSILDASTPLEISLASENAKLREEIEALKRERAKNDKIHSRDEPQEKETQKKQKLNPPCRVNLTQDDLGQLETRTQQVETEYHRESNRFYASLGNMPQYHSLKFIIASMERIENEQLADQFAASNTYFSAQKYHQTNGEPIRHVYHGTHPDNIDAIVKNNLSMVKRGQLNAGWFGAGIYFSRHADYCMMYNTTGKFKRIEVGDSGKLLQVDILPGRQLRMTSVKEGAPRTLYYDSHISPNEFEYVLFDTRHILPRYVISFEVIAAAGAKFDGSIEKTGVDSEQSEDVPEDVQDDNVEDDEVSVDEIEKDANMDDGTNSNDTDKVEEVISDEKEVKEEEEKVDMKLQKVDESIHLTSQLSLNTICTDSQLKQAFPSLIVHDWKFSLTQLQESGFSFSPIFPLDRELKYQVKIYPHNSNLSVRGQPLDHRASAYIELCGRRDSLSVNLKLMIRILHPSDSSQSTWIVADRFFSCWSFGCLLPPNEALHHFMHADSNLILQVAATHTPCSLCRS